MRVRNCADYVGFTHDNTQGGVRRRPNDVFTLTPDQLAKRRDLFKGEREMVENNERAKATYDFIKDEKGQVPKCFSFRWMEIVRDDLPERVTTAQAALNQKSEEIRQERAASRSTDEGRSSAAQQLHPAVANQLKKDVI